MYSWKTIRVACTVLLLMPIVHLAYLMARNTLETLDHSPDAWAREIADYARADARSPLPRNPIVVVGGLRVKLWQDLPSLLAPRPVLMRGIGDAIIEDIAHNYAELIGFYQPDTLILLPGNSEFFLRDSKTAADLATAIADLIKLDASFGITRRIYIFTPVKTPLRPQDYATIEQATVLLTSIAEADPRVRLLDANNLLCDPQGIPRPGYFRGDGINLNEHGYLRLGELLHHLIEAEGAQTY